MNKPSIIEINGHRYDAVTGRLLGSVSKAAASVGSLDGIVRAKSRHLKTHSQRSIHQLKRQTQRSQTLMRQVVAKPLRKKTRTKKSLIHHNPARDLRTKLSGLSVRPKLQRHEAKVHEGEVVSKAGTAALTVPATLPQLATSASHQRLERMLDYALASADSHRTVRHRVKGPAKLLKLLPGWLNITIIALVVLASGAFVAWQKVPAISLHLAASVAHVNSTMPDIPGYAIASPADAKDGALTVKYKAVDDSSKTVTVTKKTADTTDTNQLAKQECPGDNQIQTVQQNGNLGLICGQTKKAVGIDKGVVTEITANGGQTIDSAVGNALTGQ